MQFRARRVFVCAFGRAAQLADRLAVARLQGAQCSGRCFGPVAASWERRAWPSRQIRSVARLQDTPAGRCGAWPQSSWNGCVSTVLVSFLRVAASGLMVIFAAPGPRLCRWNRPCGEDQGHQARHTDQAGGQGALLEEAALRHLWRWVECGFVGVCVCVMCFTDSCRLLALLQELVGGTAAGRVVIG